MMDDEKQPDMIACKKQKREFLDVPKSAQTEHFPPRYRFCGDYLLAENCILSCYPGQISCSEEDFESLWARIPPKTPNPFNNKTFIRRRQGTYGAFYKFGNQESENLGPVEDAPKLVQRCLSDAKARAGSDADLCTVVHVNWYDSGGAWLNQHQDNEQAGMGKPIFSYSFIRRDDDSSEEPFRFFVISEDKLKKKKLASVPLFDGDLVIMGGTDFQKKLFHGVPKTSRKSMSNVRRLNLTVRMWGGVTSVKKVG